MRSIDGDAFVTLLPLRSSVDFSDTECWGSQVELEVNAKGGNLVAEQVSLTVTGRTGVVGAEVGAVSAGTQRCGVDEFAYPGMEVGAPLQAVSGFSGRER